MKNFYLIVVLMSLIACDPVVKKENQELVKIVNQKVMDIDATHRTQIVENDFHQGDSVYKIRGYFMDGYLLKIVGILHTPRVDRDDYFYFENHTPVFSGHLVVLKDQLTASEYKYYYGSDGYVTEALFWEDQYERGKRFPHEQFTEFEPDRDSLREAEEMRLAFFMEKLDMEGLEIKHLNENLGANQRK